ncbi:hypothetical protein K504DRAFT_133162 [Pleomassaria siparia CBS 279.74]|uniref:Uncharacterized protein n=1 Tax=Pleomassaria siparia CBS 279.74 TaxID=1314801 RepID=A0A6G1KK34_9PLEO|nr:hypothetical protein K504DRAFT_133162 [Pleomassaria siparia CBS 279.74]
MYILYQYIYEYKACRVRGEHVPLLARAVRREGGAESAEFSGARAIHSSPARRVGKKKTPTIINVSYRTYPSPAGWLAGWLGWFRAKTVWMDSCR